MLNSLNRETENVRGMKWSPNGRWMLRSMLQRMNPYWMGSISVVVLTNFDGSIGILHLKLPDTIKNREVLYELQEQVPTSHVVSFCITFESKFGHGLIFE